MKRWRLLILIPLSVWGITAFASFVSEESLRKRTNAESRRDYLKRIGLHLETLERRLDDLRLNGQGYRSIPEYMAVEDLELSLREVREGVRELDSVPAQKFEPLRAQLEAKISEIGGTLFQLKAQ